MTTPVREKSFPTDKALKLPRPFLLRRIHSLLGIWLVIYLFEHLLVNSQAALFFEDDGYGFVSMVNKIHAIPYLKVVEVLFLGVPFFIHGVWGILYALSGKLNAHKTDGTKPSLPQYRRNRAYSWQRITSWLLVVGILAHVIQMRFIEYPVKIQKGDVGQYMVPLKADRYLPLVAEKIFVKLYDQQEIDEKKATLRKEEEKLKGMSEQEEGYFPLLNEVQEEQEWQKGAAQKPLQEGEVLAVAPSAGAAFLLIVRQTFKSPLMVILYSLLVVASAYHGFNGVWTFMITWGVTLTRRSQARMRALTSILMGVVMILGLMAAWGTYWTTLW